MVSAPFENVLSVTDVLASHFRSGSPKTIPVTLFGRSYVMCFYLMGTGKWGYGPLGSYVQAPLILQLLHDVRFIQYTQDASHNDICLHESPHHEVVFSISQSRLIGVQFSNMMY